MRFSARWLPARGGGGAVPDGKKAPFVLKKIYFSKLFFFVALILKMVLKIEASRLLDLNLKRQKYYLLCSKGDGFGFKV